MEPPCYTAQAQKDIFETLPPKLQKEMPKKDIDEGAAYWFHKDITHPWMTLGQVFEQSFLNSDTSTNNHLQYWSDLNFVQNFYHEPFFYAHRIAQHVKNKKLLMTELAAQPGKKMSRYAIVDMNPLLDGETLFQMRVHNAVSPEEGEVFKANRFRGNLIRSFLLLQRDLLNGGASVKAYGDKDCDHGLCLARHYDKIKEFTKDLRQYLNTPAAKKIDPKLVTDKAFYTDDIDQLAAEVYGIAQSR